MPPLSLLRGFGNAIQCNHEARGIDLLTYQTTDLQRRRLIQGGAACFVYTVAGCERSLTPKEAKSERAELQTLTANEAATLERLGDVLAPGAAEAGIAYFVDAQISGAPEGFLGTLRYVDWPAPFAPFYQATLAAVDTVISTRSDTRFVDLSDDEAIALVREIGGGQPDEWPADAPPAPLAYFILRSDVVDVVYGTRDGFKRLGVPYLAHIAPSKDW